MVKHYSISLPDEICLQIDRFKAEGGNFSGLVALLVRGYFNGGGRVDSGAALQVQIAYEKLVSMLAEAERLIKLVETAKMQMEEEEKAENERIEAVKVAIRKMFDDMELMGIPGWLRELRDTGMNPTVTIRKRLNLVAAKNGISYPQAATLFVSLYPNIEPVMPKE